MRRWFFQFCLRSNRLSSFDKSELNNGARAFSARGSSSCTKCDMHFFLQHLKAGSGRNRKTVVPPWCALDPGGFSMVLLSVGATGTRTVVETRRVCAGLPLYMRGWEWCSIIGGWKVKCELLAAGCIFETTNQNDSNSTDLWWSETEYAVWARECIIQFTKKAVKVALVFFTKNRENRM